MTVILVELAVMWTLLLLMKETFDPEETLESNTQQHVQMPRWRMLSLTANSS